MKKTLLLLLLSAFVLLLRLSAGEFRTPWTDCPSLKTAWSARFPVGYFPASRKSLLENETNTSIVLRHFAGMSAGNALKWQSLHPRPGEYRWDEADALVAFAQSNRLLMRGHVIIWHNQTPDWVFKDDNGAPATRELLLARIHEHITNVIGRYRGKIFAWDIVNEAIEGKGGLRKSKWLEIIGDDYFDFAFKWAREADPTAKLFYNDYNEYEPVKRGEIAKYVKLWRERGVPVDGIGMQMHVGLGYPKLEDIQAALDLYASLGVEVHVTEWDMGVYTATNQSYPDGAPREVLIEQGLRTQTIMKMFAACKAVTYVALGNLRDPLTAEGWRGKDGRRNYYYYWTADGVPKPSFWGVLGDEAKIRSWQP